MSQSPQLQVDKSSPVLVTGATGHVAGVLIQQLLELGLTVHATVRDPSATARLQYLSDLAEKAEGCIKFFKGDLLEEGSFAEGMKGCSIVFHTASPVIMTKVSNPQKDLVDPAVNGTRNVLNEATKAGTVKRIVLTSSCAAIYCDTSDTYETPDHKLTEDHWNTGASLDYYPYAYSKTKAELAAWEVAGSQTNWTLVVMNPNVVIGPGVRYHETSESFQLIKRIGGGEWQWGCPNLCKAMVDVRDVAQAHIVAAYDSEKAKGRYILAGTNTSVYEVACILREQFPNYPIPQWTIPKLIVWLVAPYAAGLDRRFILNNVNVPVNLDNSKSKRDLGLHYRSLSESLRDMFQQMIDAGVVVPTKKWFF
jgi:dihydroflavonol-4-reductase